MNQPEGESQDKRRHEEDIKHHPHGREAEQEEAEERETQERED
jgi:hypothetical protein